jgi:hypothetical protein
MMLNGRDKPLNAVQVLQIDSFQNLSYEKKISLGVVTIWREIDIQVGFV